MVRFLGNHGRQGRNPARIVAATGCEEDEVRDVLDSRHFADTVRSYQERDHALHEAVTEGIAEWRGYRVGKATRRGYDMPEGADYLTGMVLAGVC